MLYPLSYQGIVAIRRYFSPRQPGRIRESLRCGSPQEDDAGARRVLPEGGTEPTSDKRTRAAAPAGSTRWRPVPARAGDVTMNPPPIVRRLQQAINDHDLDKIEACFEPDYPATSPPILTAPSATGGCATNCRDLGGLPDLTAELKRWAVNGEVVWTEWEWTARAATAAPVRCEASRSGLRDDVIAWVHLYMSPSTRVAPASSRRSARAPREAGA